MKLKNILVLFFVVSVWFGKSLSLPGIELQLQQVFLLFLCVYIYIDVIKSKNHNLITVSRPVKINLYFVLFSLGLIIITSMFSSLNAINIYYVIKFIIRYLSGIVIIIILLKILTNNELILKVLKYLLLGGFISILAVLISLYFEPLSLYTLRGDRAQGFLLNPNQFGIMLSTIFPITIAFVINNKKKFYYWLLLLFNILGVLLTGSKANILICLVMLIIILLASNLIKKSVLKTYLFILIVPFSLYFIIRFLWGMLEKVSPRTYNTFIQFTQSGFESTNTVSTRLEVWQEAIKLGKINFFGVGAENLYAYIPYTHAHNVFLNFYASLGIMGLVAFIIFLLSILKILIDVCLLIYGSNEINFNIKVLLLGISLGIVSYIAGNQTSDSFGGTTLPILWILIGIILALLNSNTKNCHRERRVKKYDRW